MFGVPREVNRSRSCSMSRQLEVLVDGHKMSRLRRIAESELGNSFPTVETRSPDVDNVSAYLL